MKRKPCASWLKRFLDMTTKYFFSLFILFALTAMACKHDPVFQTVEPEAPTTEKLKILWQQPMNKDTAECISMIPAYHNGVAIYSNLFYVDGYEFIKGRDIQNGALKWEWNPIWDGEVVSPQSRDYKDNIMCLSHWGPMYAINMQTGVNDWAENKQTDDNEIGLRISVIGDYLYTEHSNRLTKDTVCFLARRGLAAGSSWDTIFSLTNTVYRPSFEAPSLFVNPSGDSLLIFQNRQWAFGLSDGRIDLYAYNINKRQVEWVNNDFDPEGNSNIERPLVHNGKIYFQGTKTLYCFDASNGQILWRFVCPVNNDNLVVSNLLIAENQIFIKPSIDATLYGLDLNTGEIKTSILSTGSGGADMKYYNNFIYFGSKGNGRLYAIDLRNNQKVWDDYSPNFSRPGKWRGNTFFSGVAIVPEHNCLIAEDHYFVMAIKLPE